MEERTQGQPRWESGEIYLIVGPPDAPNQLCRIALTCTNTGKTMITVANHLLAHRDFRFFPLCPLAIRLPSFLVCAPP